ncbi:MAG: methyl-accepting chemotaxis protein, partial [Sphingomonadales bacterium]|nr:methyl-accepting chemotaxis protein [Sphingomonadales bacterium]
MLRLSNIRIPARIAIACLLPLLAFVGFASKELLQKRSDLSSMEQVAEIADATPSITGLVHELQKERGSSIGFINSKGQSFADVLRGQRPLVDKALATWQQRTAELARLHAGSKLARDIDGARAKLANLAGMRSSMDSLAVKPQEIFDYYSAVLSLLASAIDEIGELTEEAGIARQAIALGAHVRRKEWAAQERSTGVIPITTGEFSPASFFTIIRTRTIQDSQAANFKRSATSAQGDYVDSALKGPVTDDLMRLRETIYESPFTKSLKGMTSAQWLEVTQKNIDVLKTLEDRLTADFTAAVHGVLDQARWGFWGIMALFVGLLAIAGLLSIMIALSITRPIGQLVATMGELAQGHNNLDVQGTERGDEIGHMARAVLVFRDAALEKVRLEGQSAEQRQHAEDERRRNEEAQRQAAEEQAHVVESLAEGLRNLSAGDLTFRLPDEFPETYRQVRDDFNTAISGLQETIQAIATATNEVASTAAEISTSTTDLSQRTEEQAAGLEETSASMEEISATVKKNAENAQQANTFATGTREVADRGGAVVAQTVSAMARIEESSRKISDIISVIDEIARQTNLLALNAAVEAARAGEAGRGFAVVASEVRSLAQRSSQAAKDIKDLITSSSGQVQEGVDLVNRAGASLTEIVESIKRVAQIVAEIASASAEQSTGIDQVNTALTQMDEVTQQNSALVEENAAAAKALEAQSQGMSERVSFFRVGNAPSAGVAPRTAMAS